MWFGQDGWGSNGNDKTEREFGGFSWGATTWGARVLPPHHGHQIGLRWMPDLIPFGDATVREGGSGAAQHNKPCARRAPSCRGAHAAILCLTRLIVLAVRARALAGSCRGASMRLLLSQQHLVRRETNCLPRRIHPDSACWWHIADNMEDGRNACGPRWLSCSWRGWRRQDVSALQVGTVASQHKPY